MTMESYDIGIIALGCVMGCILLCALLVRYCNPHHYSLENPALPPAEQDQMDDGTVDANKQPVPFTVSVLLEDESGEYEAFPTVSQLLARSNGAYTVNVVAACLVGLVLGYDFHRPDGLSTIPNLFVAGLLLVLLSPGDQTNPRQKRLVCFLPLKGGCRGLLHAVGFILFALGFLVHIALHSFLLQNCDDPGLKAHDTTFVALPAVFLALFIVFLFLFSGLTKQRKAQQQARDAPGAAPESDAHKLARLRSEEKWNKGLFFYEVVLVVGGLMVYFAHSIDSHFTQPRNPACLLFT